MYFVYFLLIIRIFINSFNFIIVKYLDPSFSPFVITILRGIIASFVIFIFFRKRLIFDFKNIRLFLFLSIFGVVLNQTLFVFGGLKTISPHIAVIYSLTPLVIHLISVVIGDEKKSLRRLAGIFLGFAGVLFIIYEKGIDINSDFLYGDIAILMGSFVWSTYTVLSKRQSLVKDSFTLTVNVLFYGGLMYTILGVPVFYKEILSSVFSFKDILIIVYFALFTSLASYVIWNYVIKMMDASSASLVQNAQIILTTILAVFLFEYIPGYLFVTGALLTLLGIFITNIRTKNNKIEAVELKIKKK